jgi:hypothetical protein
MEDDGRVCVVVRVSAIARTARQGTLEIHGFLDIKRVSGQQVKTKARANESGTRKAHFDDDGTLGPTCGTGCRVAQLELVQLVSNLGCIQNEPREQDQLRCSGQEKNQPRGRARFLELVCEKHGFGTRVKNLCGLHLFRSK